MIFGATSLAQLVAAISAVALARRRVDHRPIALALVVVTVASLGRAAMHAWVLRGGPYAGWARAAFHLEQALWLAGPATLAWVTLVALHPRCAMCPKAPILDRIHREANQIVLAGLVGPIWVTLSAACVCLYPALRDGPLRLFYLAAQLSALLVCVASVVAWLRRWGHREVTLPAAIVLLLVACSLGDLLAGAWRYGLFGAAYETTQWILLVMYTVIAIVQIGVLAWSNGSP
jgi:hypothetical protein